MDYDPWGTPKEAFPVESVDREAMLARVRRQLRAADTATLSRVARVLSPPDTAGLAITTPDRAVEVVRSHLDGLDHERLVVLALDKNAKVLASTTLTVGNDGYTIVCPKQIFRWALTVEDGRCSAIILAHNHPSGNPDPSPQDIDVTERVARAGGVVGIRVLDHVILGGGGWVSLAARGKMPYVNQNYPATTAGGA